MRWPRLTATLGGGGPNRVMCQDREACAVHTPAYAGHGVEIEEDVIRLRRPDRTVLLLVALYACWGSAIPAMKLMVDTVPPVGGAALVFLLAGVVLAGAARGRPRPTRVQLRHLAVAGVLLLVGGQGLATVALTAVTASLGAILAAAIPLWVVLLSGLTGVRVSVASWVRLVAGFGGIMIVVLTAPDSAIGGAPWAVAAFCVAPILWAAGSLLTAKVERPVDRVAASAVRCLPVGLCCFWSLCRSVSSIRLGGRTSAGRRPGRRSICSSSTRSSASCSTRACWKARRRRWSVPTPTSRRLSAP